MTALRGLADLTLEASVVGSFSRLGYVARRRLFDWPEAGTLDLAGRTVAVTGATSGIGLAVATAVAGLGAEVSIVGRDPDRTAAARRLIERRTGSRRVRAEVADLARLDDIRGLARAVATHHDRLDVLVHNAGALVHDRVTTADGLELTAQTHVVAPHLLTAELLPLLRRSREGGRVITVSSGGLYTRALRVAALAEPPDPFDGTRAYAHAKRAQVVLAGQWAQRAAGAGVAFHAMHPGWVDTPGLAAALPVFHRRMAGVLRAPEQGADTIVWLAAAHPAGIGATGFWLDRHRRWIDRVPWTVTGDAAAGELWRWATGAAGLDPSFLGEPTLPGSSAGPGAP
jgi:NAD(P)-dependent dehydrogenase (short-subunit alcohol dehydrogenase family)